MGCPPRSRRVQLHTAARRMQQPEPLSADLIARIEYSEKYMDDQYEYR